MPREEHRRLNGLSHRLLVWDEEPGAPTLVLLHGWLDVAWSFVPFAEALRRERPLRIVAPDLRGHGGTQRVGAGGYYHFADYVADVYDLLGQLESPVFLLGHSMGGSIATLVAGSAPELVSRLLLVEGLGPPTVDDDTPPARMRRWLDEVRARNARPPRPMLTLADAARRLHEANPRLDEATALSLAEQATTPLDGGFVWAYDPLHRTRSPMPFRVEPFRDYLRAITCPTLLVEGAESAFRGWITDDRERDVRSLSTVVVADAGHMVHQDQPDELARLVADFLG